MSVGRKPWSREPLLVNKDQRIIGTVFTPLEAGFTPPWQNVKYYMLCLLEMARFCGNSKLGGLAMINSHRFHLFVLIQYVYCFSALRCIVDVRLKSAQWRFVDYCNIMARANNLFTNYAYISFVSNIKSLLFFNISSMYTTLNPQTFWIKCVGKLSYVMLSPLVI